MLLKFSKNQILVTSIFSAAFIFSIQFVSTLVFIISVFCKGTIECLHNIPYVDVL